MRVSGVARLSPDPQSKLSLQNWMTSLPESEAVDLIKDAFVAAGERDIYTVGLAVSCRCCNAKSHRCAGSRYHVIKAAQTSTAMYTRLSLLIVHVTQLNLHHPPKSQHMLIFQLLYALSAFIIAARHPLFKKPRLQLAAGRCSRNPHHQQGRDKARHTRAKEGLSKSMLQGLDVQPTRHISK